MPPFQSEPIHSLACMNGIIQLHSDRIPIHKKGLLAHLFPTFPGDSQTTSLYRLIGIKLYLGLMSINGVIRLITSKDNLLLFVGCGSHRQALDLKGTIEDLLSRQRVFPEQKRNCVKLLAQYYFENEVKICPIIRLLTLPAGQMGMPAS